MAKSSTPAIITALDIGTTKIVALVGVPTPEGNIEIIGIGSHPSRGLKRGVVVNIEVTLQSIQQAIADAEEMAGCRIGSAYAGIAGAHIQSLNSHGIVAIRSDEVTAADMERVIEAAKAVVIPANQKILHILPQEFAIDDQEGITEPVGMSGVRLESKVHIVTGSVSATQNIVKCVQGAGLKVDNIILEQLASSYSVLTEDEKEIGVCLVDIGGGTTDIAVFVNGAIRHTAVIPVAGDQVTNDIAIALRTPTHHAEQIKLQEGCALSRLLPGEESFRVPSAAQTHTREASKTTLTEVIEARYEELFTLILDELKRSGFSSLIAAGIVLTGGAAKMHGAIELAEIIFQMPVRLGQPENKITGLIDQLSSPKYSTAVGLLLYGQQQQLAHGPSALQSCHSDSVWQRMKLWFKENF